MMKSIPSSIAIPLLIFATGCQMDPITLVRDGALEQDTSVSIGAAFENYTYFEEVLWEAFATKNGREIVEIVCAIRLEDITIADMLNGLNDALGVSALMTKEEKSSDHTPLSSVLKAGTVRIQFVLTGKGGFQVHAADITVAPRQGEALEQALNNAEIAQMLTEVYDDELLSSFMALFILVAGE